MATQVIRLYENQKKVIMRYDDAGVFEHSITFDSLSEIKEYADRKTILLLPGAHVHMLTLTLPKMSSAELQQAVPNALEEQLSQDIQELHFSIGDADAQNQRYVAVIQKKIWDSLIKELKENDLSPDVIIPDYLALPLDPECWTIYCDDQYALGHLLPQQGFATDIHLLPTLIPLTLRDTHHTPNEIKIIHDPTTNAPQLDTTLLKSKMASSFEKILQPNQLIARPPFNMRSRQLRKKRQPMQRSYWYWCGMSAVGLIALLFLGQLVLYIDFTLKIRHLDQQLMATYKKIVPQDTPLTQAQARVEQEIRAYTLAPNPFILILQKVAAVKSKNSHIVINSLLYTQNKITLTILASDTAQLEQFTKELTATGLTLSSTQSHAADKQITATLTVGI